MRITNKIIQKNNLANINTNKIYQDKLSTQMATEKKINRPSDDPVVAIRALRLRGNVTEVTQYYSKNIPDAESWLEVTEDALKNLSEVLTEMIKQCTKGANGDLTTADRQTILEQLKALGDEVYKTGDADFAGRYVFTGFRTNTSLSFDTAKNIPYEITEQIDKSWLDSVTHVNTKSAATGWDVKDINSSNYASVDIKEGDITSTDVYRLRLSYNNCDDTVPTITYQESDGAGGYTEQNITATVVHSYDDPDPYTQMAQNTSTTPEAIFIPETGELLLNAAAYEALMATKDDPSTSGVDEGEIRVTYQKSEWQKGDLRPEHYFACKSNPGTADETQFNNAYLDGTAQRQSIEYDVGFNQTIQVNTTADECFKQGIGREVDDIVASLQDLIDLEKIKTELENLLQNASGNDAETIQNKLDVVNKAYEWQKDKTQRLFEHGITSFQKYLDETNLALTNVGTRSSKLSQIKSRMQTQKTTFEELKSENEDVDITEVIINLTSAKLTYEAALMAVGKISQTSLLNFI